MCLYTHTHTHTGFCSLVVAFFLVLFSSLNAQQGSLVQHYAFDCDNSMGTIYYFDIDPSHLPLQSLDYVSDQGFDLFSVLSLNPTLGYIDIEANVENSYLEYGSAVFEGFDGVETFQFTVSVISCCNEQSPPAYDEVWIDALVSEASPFGFNSFQHILVLGSLEVDDFYSAYECVFDMGVDGRIEVQPGYFINGIDSEFRSFCDYYWDGIHAHNATSEVNLDGCEIRNGLRAVYVSNNAPTGIAGCNFEHNPRSVIVEGFTAGGSFGYDSYFSFFGNVVNLSNPYTIYSHHPLSPIDMNLYTPPSLVSGDPNFDNSGWGYGIFVKSSPYVEIGYGNSTPSRNANLFWMYDSGVDYSHIVADDSDVRIEHNEFTNGEALRAENSSAIRMGGVDDDEKNYLDNSGVRTIESSITFMGNTVEESVVFIEDAVHTTPPISDPGVLISENYFNATQVQIVNWNASVTRYHVKMNLFEGSPISGVKAQRVEGNANGRLIINDNYFGDVGEPDAEEPRVELLLCSDAGIGDNMFISDAGLYPANSVAIQLENSTDIEVNGNELNIEVPPVHTYYTYHSGIKIIGNNVGSSYSCNLFVQVYYPFNLVDATIDDFGDANQGANNVFAEIPPLSAPVQSAITGSITNTATYYNDDTYIPSASYTYGTNPDDFGSGISVTGALLDNDPLASSGCDLVPQFRMSNEPFEMLTSIEDDWILYPNPSEGNNIQVRFNYEESRRFAIYDVGGKLIWEGLVQPEGFLASNLLPGHYLVECQNDSKRSFQKLIVTR